MRREKINYFIVGLFVLSSMVILLAMLYKVTDVRAGAVLYLGVFENFSMF